MKWTFFEGHNQGSWSHNIISSGSKVQNKLINRFELYEADVRQWGLRLFYFKLHGRCRTQIIILSVNNSFALNMNI